VKTATVKWFDKAKGYGFLICGDQEIFAHYSKIQTEGFKTLLPGMTVEIEIYETEKGLMAGKIFLPA